MVVLQTLPIDHRDLCLVDNSVLINIDHPKPHQLLPCLLQDLVNHVSRLVHGEFLFMIRDLVPVSINYTPGLSWYTRTIGFENLIHGHGIALVVN